MRMGCVVPLWVLMFVIFLAMLNPGSLAFTVPITIFFFVVWGHVFG